MYLPYYRKSANHEIGLKCLTSTLFFSRRNFQFTLFPCFSAIRMRFFFDIVINFVRVDFKSDSLISCNKVCIPVAVDGSFHLRQHTPFALSFLP